MCNLTFLQSVREVGPGVHFFTPFQRVVELGSRGVGEAEARRPRDTQVFALTRVGVTNT